MEKRGSKSSKKERIKLRKKLLENGSSIVPSKAVSVPSDNILTNEKSVKERTEKKKPKLSGKKRKEQSLGASDVEKFDRPTSHSEDEKSVKERTEKKKPKLSGKKRKEQSLGASDVEKVDHLTSHNEDKSERAGKKKKKGQVASEKIGKLMKKESESVANEVYHISSANSDSSKGMKKWINEYYQSRPGLKILQGRIDDFIITHEEQEEQARKEREERAAEGGWTVVVHQKGRKKTTDSETGTAVGGVAQAAVLDKMGRKKMKDVGDDFYRFQKREAQRSEIMLLQSKFEEDKKRIQQLRAARKFRPY